MAAAPIDLADKLGLFTDLWSPKVVARMNDYEVKVVKVQGEFEWHTHEDTDELFLVIAGRLTIQLRDGDVTLGPSRAGGDLDHRLWAPFDPAWWVTWGPKTSAHASAS